MPNDNNANVTAYALLEPEYIRMPVDLEGRHHAAKETHLDLSFELSEREEYSPVTIAPFVAMHRTIRNAERHRTRDADLLPLNIDRDPKYDYVLVSIGFGTHNPTPYDDTRQCWYPPNYGDGAHRKQAYFWLPKLFFQDLPLFDTYGAASAARIGLGQYLVKVYELPPTEDDATPDNTERARLRRQAEQRDKEFRAEMDAMRERVALFKRNAGIGTKKQIYNVAPGVLAPNRAGLFKEFNPHHDYDPAPAGDRLVYAPGQTGDIIIISRNSRLERRIKRTYRRGYRLEQDLTDEPLNHHNYRWVQRRNRT